MVLFILASLTACKKDSDPAPSTSVEGSWQITAIKIVPSYSGISDYLAYYTLIGDTCPSQITFNFKANNSLEIVAPATCTDTKDELSELLGVNNTTTWEIDGQQLILTTAGFEFPADLTVDATTMSLGQSGLDLGDNTDRTVTFVFKRL